MPDNFRTIHSSGTIKLVYKGKVRKELSFSSIKQRKLIMGEWKRLMRYKKYYVAINHNWYLWNGKLN